MITLPIKTVHTAAETDIGRCLSALTLAFSGDPPSRWAWPDPQQFLSAFPRFARAFGGRAFQLGTAWYSDGFSGVSLWLPPGEFPNDDLLTRVFEETVSRERRDGLFQMFEKMSECHPVEPHWHLPLIGVDPAYQGQGIGATLQRHVLVECDRQQVVAYLEATSPRSLPFYERLGFEVITRIQVADAPPVFPMLRRPRPS